jgi:hypothetical protein
VQRGTVGLFPSSLGSNEIEPTKVRSPSEPHLFINEV